MTIPPPRRRGPAPKARLDPATTREALERLADALGIERVRLHDRLGQTGQAVRKVRSHGMTRDQLRSWCARLGVDYDRVVTP